MVKKSDFQNDTANTVSPRHGKYQPLPSSFRIVVVRSLVLKEPLNLSKYFCT